MTQNIPKFLSAVLIIKNIFGLIAVIYVTFIVMLFYGGIWVESQVTWARLFCGSIIWSGLFYAISTYWLHKRRRWAWTAVTALECLYLLISAFVFLKTTLTYLNNTNYVNNVLLKGHTMIPLALFLLGSLNVIYFCRSQVRNYFTALSKPYHVLGFALGLLLALGAAELAVTQWNVDRAFRRYVIDPKPASVKIISFKSATFMDTMVNTQFHIDPSEIGSLTSAMQQVSCSKIVQHFYPQPPFLDQAECYGNQPSKTLTHPDRHRRLQRFLIWNTLTRTVFFQATSNISDEEML